MVTYNENDYYIDFTDRQNLSDNDKKTLEEIQKKYRPVERAEYLNEFVYSGKITTDDMETMTGIPYSF